MKSQALKNKLKMLAPAVLFFVFTFVFYGPLSLYLPNSQELWFGLGSVFKIVSVFSLAVFAIAFAVGLLLPEKLTKFFVKLGFGVTLGLYIQGNFININYGTGVMDGTEIDWGSYSGYAVINTIVWIVCIALPFIIDPVLKKIKKAKNLSAVKIITVLSLFFVAIQIPAFATQLIQYKPNAQGNLQISSDGMFDYSDKENTVVFVLDTLDQKYYDEFIESNPQYKETLGGFTEYNNTVTAGARTILAMPAMFTGKPFMHDETYTEYLNKIWAEENALSLLTQKGTDVRVFTETTYFSKDCADFVANFETDGSSGSTRILAVKLYKLAVYKFAPHLAKRYFYMNTSEFNDAKNAVDRFKVNDAKFIAKYRDEGITVNSAYGSAFRFYHMHGAHAAFNLDENGKSVKKSNLQAQTKGCFTMIGELLGEMKSKGIYDGATIIITADHGDLDKAQHPALLIKNAGESEGYTVSDKPVSMFDLPVLFASLSGSQLENQQYGCSIDSLKDGEKRVREFFVNTSGSSQIDVVHYSTDSKADDYAAVKALETFTDELGADTPCKLGETLSFGADATGNRYAVEGFGSNTGFRTVARGPYIKLEVPIENLPEKGSLDINFDILAEKDQTIRVYANGECIYDEFTKAADIAHNLTVNAPLSIFTEETGNVLTLEFKLPDTPEEQLELPVLERDVVLSFKTMTFTEGE